MAENYLPVGLERLRVLGRLLPEAEANGSAIAFEVVVPARYAIVAEHGTVRGSLDGSAYEGPRFLAPGRHELRTDPADTVRLAVLWARAAEQGLTPFHLQEAAS
jgi:hypothetical protein